MSELWDVCPCGRCEQGRCEQAIFGWVIVVLLVALVGLVVAL